MTKATIVTALENWESTRSADAKKAFHRIAKKRLKEVTEFLALKKGTFDIRSCLGGPAVLGEVVLHAESFYVSISEHSYYRKCNGLTDYTGELNHNMCVVWLSNDARTFRTACVLHNLSGLGDARTLLLLDTVTLPNMDIEEIAYVISTTWEGVSIHAAPYLKAMHTMSNINDSYGADSGKMIVAYFLANATQYRGAVARLVKKELNRRLP
jgi:hypothetical protein